MKNLYLVGDIYHELEWLHREKQITDSGWKEIVHLLSSLHKSVIVPERVFLEMEENADNYDKAYREGYETARNDWPRNRFENSEEITRLLLDLAEPQTLTNNEHPIP
jgi:hypothetical protein